MASALASRSVGAALKVRSSHSRKSRERGVKGRNWGKRREKERATNAPSITILEKSLHRMPRILASALRAFASCYALKLRNIDTKSASARNRETFASCSLRGDGFGCFFSLSLSRSCHRKIFSHSPLSLFLPPSFLNSPAPPQPPPKPEQQPSSTGPTEPLS